MYTYNVCELIECNFKGNGQTIESMEVHTHIDE